jgi:hypothetical protein
MSLALSDPRLSETDPILPNPRLMAQLGGCTPNPPRGPWAWYLSHIGGKRDLPQTIATQTMRKIEQQMNTAINREIDWKSANTEVTNIDGVSYVYLHGNKIAEVGDTWMQLFDGGWQSNTTKSRLNALLNGHGVGGEGVFQKNHTWFFRMSDGCVVPFFSGIRLN